MEKIIIIGCGGHANSVIDSIKQKDEYEIVGYVDKENKGSINDISYLGCDDDLENIYNNGIHYAFVCVGFLGNSNLRNNIYDKLKSIGFKLPIIIDVTAILPKTYNCGEGTFIGKNVVINANASIGKMCIINSKALIEHDCKIGDFSHIAVSACLCGGVKVGERCFIGANSTIVQYKNIGNDIFIGAGIIITDDVNDNTRLTIKGNNFNV